MRPKVGRPPVAEVFDHPMASALRSRREVEKNRFDPRFALLAMSLILLIALTLASLMNPAPQIPPTAIAASAPPKPRHADQDLVWSRRRLGHFIHPKLGTLANEVHSYSSHDAPFKSRWPSPGGQVSVISIRA